MSNYAKLYARLCGAIDEVLDAEAQYLDAAEEKMPAGYA